MHNNKINDTLLRKTLENILSGGLEVELEPRAYSHEQIRNVVSRLQSVDAKDYKNKLQIAGFTLSPWIEDDDEQACETCMYFKIHQKFCEIPELMLPVEANWSCRIWRI